MEHISKDINVGRDLRPPRGINIGSRINDFNTGNRHDIDIGYRTNYGTDIIDWD